MALGTWQIGGLAASRGGIRIVVSFDHDDEVPTGSADVGERFMTHERTLLDVRAETVVNEWLFWRSLLLRDGDGEIVRGALRCGALRWDRLLEAAYDWASHEQVAYALAAVPKDSPTDRQQRHASQRLKPEALREMLAHALTIPELGGEFFRRWGLHFERWGVAAGPLSARGQRRHGDASQRAGEDDDDVSRRLSVALGTPGQRRHRDRQKSLPTRPRKALTTRPTD